MKAAKFHPLAAAFYEEHRPYLGDDFLDLIEETLLKIRSAPEMGRPEKFGARSWKMRRFPFRIFFLVNPDRIWIVAVAYLSRKPDYWWNRVD